jgi:hypothetical protein
LAFLECGAFPPLFFFRFSTVKKQNKDKAAEKRRTPKKGKATSLRVEANLGSYSWTRP